MGVRPRSSKRASVLGGGAIAPTGRRPENRLGAIKANPLGSATQSKTPTLRGRFCLCGSAWT